MKSGLLMLFTLLSLSSSYSQNYKPLSLPSIISDNMVLQQNSEVPIWGWTSPNEEVNIFANWLDNPIIVKADDNGNWSAKLKTKGSSGNYSISIVSQAETVIISNILFGEVWLASGQSNMEMPLKGWGENLVSESDETLNNSANPNIRLFQVEKNTSTIPLDNCTGSWAESNPESAENFSAVAYFFANKMHNKLNVPIGIIHSSWGGTKAQSWVKKERLQEMNDFKENIETLDSRYSEFEKDIKVFTETLKKWCELKDENRFIDFVEYSEMNKRVLEKWKKLNNAQDGYCENLDDYPKPKMPEKFPQFMETTLYNAMIHPLIPFAIKGVIWYQGESNAINPNQYRTLFPLLINNWRTDWQQGEFPFYYVQIAPFPYLDDEEGHWDPVLLRDVQLQTLSKVSNVGMVVTTDVSDTTNIHPPKKKEVGERLALWALAKNYGKDVVFSGPIYKSMKIENNKIRLFFEYAETGLTSNKEELTFFEIAEESGNYLSATAIIDGNSILVSNPSITNPKSVRFGWSHTAQPNLFNGAGLPASPFNTK